MKRSVPLVRPAEPFFRRSNNVAAYAGLVAIVAVFSLLFQPTTGAVAASSTPEPIAPVAPVAPASSPSILSPADSSFVGTAAVAISGTADAGASVRLVLSQDGQAICSTEADDAGRFECSASLPDGANVGIRVFQDDASGNTTAGNTVGYAVLTPPMITPNDGGGVLTNGLIRGTGYPGATANAFASNGETCSFIVDDSGNWACVLDGTASASSLTISASQSAAFTNGASSESSAQRSLTLDREAPAPPTLTSPAQGATLPTDNVTFTGTGEDGALIKVFAGSATVCTATASGGVWSCVGRGITAGVHDVVVIEIDAAGNVSDGSAVASFRFGAASSGGPTLPATPKPGTSTASPRGEIALPGQPSTSPEAGSAPGPWAEATPFTEALPMLNGDDNGDPWWPRAVVLALITAFLVLIPARLLASSWVLWRRKTRMGPLLRRNGEARESGPAPALENLTFGTPGRFTMGIIGITASATAIVFANPIGDELAYIRLFVASCIAVVLVNVVSVIVPRAVGSAVRSGFADARFNPRYLLIALGMTLASRLLDLSPALVFALVFIMRLPSVLSTSLRAKLALTRIGSVFLVGLGSWFGASLLPPPSGFFSALLTETANIVAIAGVGSAAVMMVPLGRLSGRAILAWSKPTWLASVLVILTALFALLGATLDSWDAAGATVAALVAVVCFAAVGFSAWLWRRFIQPNLT